MKHVLSSERIQTVVLLRFRARPAIMTKVEEGGANEDGHKEEPAKYPANNGCDVGRATRVVLSGAAL